jgi:MoaA/NifB/PqqE/SkfB family radical SAM enzyme
MSQKGSYSEKKAVWWLMRDGGLPDVPKQVQLIISDFCNQNCSFCAYRMDGYSSNELFVGNSKLAATGHNNPIRFMDAERALRLVDEIKAAGVLGIQYTGGGEVLTHPRHEDIMERALNIGLRCALVTNGFKMRDRVFGLLTRFDWVRISVDAGTDETYCRIREVPTGSLWKTMANASRLTRMVADAKSATQVGIGYVVTPDNYREIVEGVRLASGVGAHSIRLSAMFSPENEKPFIDIHGAITESIAKARGLYERPGFAVYDNFGSRYSDLRQHSPDYKTCGYQYYTTYIGGDMQMYRCCVLAYNRRGTIAGGNLTTRRFDEYWASEDRKKDFGSFDARGCGICQFNEKNRELLYVLGDTESDTVSRHIEWP